MICIMKLVALYILSISNGCIEFICVLIFFLSLFLSIPFLSGYKQRWFRLKGNLLFYFKVDELQDWEVNTCVISYPIV